MRIRPFLIFILVVFGLVGKAAKVSSFEASEDESDNDSANYPEEFSSANMTRQLRLLSKDNSEKASSECSECSDDWPYFDAESEYDYLADDYFDDNYVDDFPPSATEMELRVKDAHAIKREKDKLHHDAMNQRINSQLSLRVALRCLNQPENSRRHQKIKKAVNNVVKRVNKASEQRRRMRGQTF